MSTKTRGEIIRRQILSDVRHHPSDIAAHISQIFSISRQAVNKHLKKLVETEFLAASGTTRNRTYTLGPTRKNSIVVPLDSNTSEHDIYFKNFAWVFEGLPKNIDDIVFYGFTEMVNNAIDHSQGSQCTISTIRTKSHIFITIGDNGEGIFKRITRLKGLSDERQALLELHKGKLTTDPNNHSGQGIFFTSRMFDNFQIVSYGLAFGHFDFLERNTLVEVEERESINGTIIFMDITLDSTRTDKEIFDQFSSGEDDDYAFNKTVIPASLAKFGNENLVSRSQAKRLLTRIENFQYVEFDFTGVESIGQAFADEIFRVYRLRHPKIHIDSTNTNQRVIAMIKRAEAELSHSPI